jgi:probable rRNA maturation factor
MTHPLELVVNVIEDAALPEGADVSKLSPLLRHVLEAEGRTGEWAVNIALMTDEALRALHRDFMGVDTVTDVMTFPNDPEPWGQEQGGDIAISVDRAAAQAPEFGTDPWEEIRFLVAHGALHLCEWDDASDADRERMLARQRELIDSFDRAVG